MRVRQGSLRFPTREQAKFDWAHTWMEEGGYPALAESKAQRLLT